MYVGGYGGLSESGFVEFRKLCPVRFLVFGKCSSVLLQSIVMSFVECGGYKRHSIPAMDLSHRLWKIVWTPPAPSKGARFTVFWQAGHVDCGPVVWLALLLIKAGYIETNPRPTTKRKQVWICDICNRQIHDRNQISIRCNMIEH